MAPIPNENESARHRFTSYLVLLFGAFFWFERTDWSARARIDIYSVADANRHTSHFFAANTV
jgi:hypothetical protein